MDRAALDNLDVTSIPDRAIGEDELLVLAVVRRRRERDRHRRADATAVQVASAEFGAALADAVGTTTDRVHLVVAAVDVEAFDPITAEDLAELVAGEDPGE